MLDDDTRSLYSVVTKLKEPRDEKYFEGRRRFLAERLRTDPERSARYPLSSDTDTPDPKRIKISTQQEKINVTELLETFVKAFIASTIKKIGANHITAKGERLTEEALKTELKTGLTGGLFGIVLSQSIVGAIPSLVASLRLLSSKYYLSKAKAQKITKAFSETESNLSLMLAEAATGIFYSFESQFMHVTDKAGKKIAMEKLADDAAERTLNYIAKLDAEPTCISKQLIEKGVLLGRSENFFDPNIKPARVRISGNMIQDETGNAINTANLFEKVGLIVKNAESQIQFYKTKQRTDSHYYGYRRLLAWEEASNGELQKLYKDQYEKESFPQKESFFQFSSRRYHYSLEKTGLTSQAQAILTKLTHRYPQKPMVDTQKTLTKTAILFNLRKPIPSFTGRSRLLSQLHHLLIKDRTIAIIPSLSSLLSPPPADLNLPSSGSQISISGLGGIGKTQLVLRYAELYAAEYDYNILWIDAETQENIAYSFVKLANKLQLDIKNRYAQEKTTEEIVEDIYDYFSDRKSLFILDNVENYRTIEPYLPKSMLGNKPTLLITSRYTNWKNVASILALDVFTQEETKELAHKLLQLPQDHPIEKINELHTLLQGLPLALQQAMAYINLQT